MVSGLSAVAGNTSVNISWLAPSSNGGSSVILYTITYSPSSGTAGTAINTTSLSYAFTGLTNGQTYVFLVAAVNAVGKGESAEIIATPGMRFK